MKTSCRRFIGVSIAVLLSWAVCLSVARAADEPTKDAAPAAAKAAKKAAAKEPTKSAPVEKAVEKKTPAKAADSEKVPAKKAGDGDKKPVPLKKVIEKKIELPEKAAKEKDEKKEPPKPKLPPIAAWKAPEAADVQTRLLAWLDERKPDAALRAKAEQIWASDPAEATGTDLLVRAAATFALVDEPAGNLVRICSKPRIDLLPPSAGWLLDPTADRFMANNLRLLFGRWLAHEMLYDEAHEQLEGLNPEDVVDPASLLFYQSVVNHRLLDREASLRTIDGLMLDPEQSPRRYVVLAGLMREDIKGLKDDTLDHIARRMEDIERRLELGRAGKRVRAVEDGVIESLDKLIKKLEEQQQQSSSSSSSGNNIRSSSPAPDSLPMGGKGPGNVVKRDIGSKAGWGNLPPKKRDEALQQIGRDFPSHYRDKIEEYFRKLANESSQGRGE